jgi:tetratricopeptide (TPR) repeat protein
MKKIALVFFGLLSLLIARPLRADSITINTLNYPGVRIDRIEGAQVYYSLNGDFLNKPVGDLVTMSLDDEPDFNAAETAYQQQQWSAATDGYIRAMAGTMRQWLKDWMAPRLLNAANQAGRFDAAVAAWVHIVGQDPAAGAKVRPVLPKTATPDLATAARELNDAAKLAQGDSQVESRRLILGLLLEVQTARQDSAAADAVAQQLQALPPPRSAAPAIDAIERETGLAVARTDLNNHQYDQASALLDSVLPGISDPVEQSQGLLLKAQILEGKAAAHDTPDNWKDAALAYMRLYVRFPREPAAPGALVKTAQIEETHLHEAQAALTLYQKVVNEYKDTVEAGDSSSQINRLSAAATH